MYDLLIIAHIIAGWEPYTVPCLITCPAIFFPGLRPVPHGPCTISPNGRGEELSLKDDLDHDLCDLCDLCLNGEDAQYSPSCLGQ